VIYIKCPKENCDGEFKVRGSRMSKRTGFWTRKRICDKCGFTDIMIEVSKTEFGKQMELVESIAKAVEEYNFDKEEDKDSTS